jgi:short-subunit dehydrogenase
MAVSRQALAGRNFWMTAEAVVEASLDGLRRRKLFVIPGWRYRVLTAIVTKLPAGVRLPLEALGGRGRLTQNRPEPQALE